MAHLNTHPLPATARHDADGSHVPPHIPGWRNAADPGHYAYDPMRVARGREVERDQQQNAAFAAHLAEHRRLGQPDTVIEEIRP